LFGRKAGESILVCIYPLNSLMIDQYRNFTSKGIAVKCVGEIQHDKQVVKILLNGKVPLILITLKTLPLMPFIEVCC
jgi:bloom syndrome protein